MSTQRSLFQLANVAGYNDLPDSLLAQGKIANQLALSAIQSNADFACVGFEIFYFEISDGQEVPLDRCRSAVDGYSYRRSELLYLPEIRTTVDMQSGLPAGPGGFILGSYKLNQKIGKASIMEAYYVPGETWTNTNQGTLGVWVIGQRGRGRIKIAGSPSFAVIADSEFNTDNALTQARIRNLNDNARSSIPKIEAFLVNGSGKPYWQPGHAYSPGDFVQPNYGFEDGCWYEVLIGGTSGDLEPEWPGEFGGLILDGGVLWIAIGFGAVHGQTMPYPVSPVDGHVYSASDACYYLPWWYYTGAVQLGTQIPMGPSVTSPRMYRLRKSVTSRVVDCQVDYHQNIIPINTNDGVLGIMAICVRPPGAITPEGSVYVETDGSQFVAGETPTDVNLKTLNQNINFARLRPEAFLSSGKVNGNAIPLPTSPPSDGDGYDYNRAELLYLTILNDTGVPTGLSANYALRCILFYTDAQLGIVTSRIDYFSQGNPATSTNGVFSILTLAFRKAETLLSGVSIIPIVGQATPAPPGDVNLIPNGGMEVWSHLLTAGVQMVGLPDLWSYYQNTQDGYPTQQPGLEGAYALGLNVGDAHGAPNMQYMTTLSYPVAIFPGGTYYFSILARANPGISAGFRVRLHFRDENFENDTYVTLMNGIGLGTTKQKFESRLVMPLQGDLTMQTGKWGTLTIVGGPLGYDPAYVFLELGNQQPNISSTIIFDSATLKNVGEVSNQPGSVAVRPTSNMLTATDAGASATINIGDFTLRVSGQADVDYDGLASISSLAYGTLYFVYCDDPTLRGGTQTCEATVTQEEAMNGVGRIFLGSIWTPAAGAADTVGNNDGGVGAQYALSRRAYFPDYATAVTGNGAVADPELAVDLIMTTAASLSLTGNSGANSASIRTKGLTAALEPPVKDRKAWVIFEIPTNTLNGTGNVWSLYYSVQGDTGYVLWDSGGAGVTKARTTYSLNIPQYKLSDIRVRLDVMAGASQTTGTITAKLYESWVEVF